MSRSFRALESDVTLGALLSRLGESPEAVADGRVFVERRRARDLEAKVSAGDEVVVHAEAGGSAEGDIVLLGEWQDLHAVLKPAGLSTEPDRHGGASLLRSAALLLDVPVSVLHAATRLDAAVSGIVIVARGNDAARRVATLQQEGLLRRRYLALATGALLSPAGTWNGAIGKGEKGRPVLGGKDPRPAATRYRAANVAPASGGKVTASFLVLEPMTGRSHQLRVHAAAAGAPLLGDAMRGGARRLILGDGRALPVERVALHAGLVQVLSGEYVEWSVRAPHPGDLQELFRALGGESEAFDAALDAPWLDDLPRS